MEFYFNCLYCAQPILLGIDHIGVTISCPHCRSSFTVPDQADQQNIFQPFTEDELLASLQGFDEDLIVRIQQVEKNGLCWPSAIFAAMIDATLAHYLLHQTYEPPGGSLFTSTSKGKKNIIAKQLEYFEIIGKMLNSVGTSFRIAVDSHDIYSMRNFIESLREHLVQLDQFFHSLESLDYPGKTPYEYLVERMIGWKDEFCYSVKTVVLALQNRGKLDPDTAALSTVEVSLTPMAIFEFNDILFNA